MQQRNLGCQDLVVSELGLGCMGMSEYYGTADEEESVATLLHQGDDIVPIPGTRRRERLEENVAAADIEFTNEDLDRIEEVSPKGAAAGERYNEAGMQTINC